MFYQIFLKEVAFDIGMVMVKELKKDDSENLVFKYKFLLKEFQTNHITI
jgi:hypothetical protein